jgi:signal transduction histidine kinase
MILDNATAAIEYVSEVLSLQSSYAPESQEMKEKVRLNQLVKDALKIQKATISTACLDQKISLTIADTGCGVESDNLKGIFDFGIATKGSSGFGLYYCKRFVEANNGVLTLTSPGRNQGATVTMAFSFLE